MIAAEVASLRAEIAEHCRVAGRDPAPIDIIAVTKAQEPAVLAPLAATGLRCFGENRLPHLRAMHAAAPDDTRFHFIGVLQSRQLKHLLPLVDGLHALCRLDHIQKLQQLCEDSQRSLDVFIQVNTAGEAQKSGCTADELPALIAACQGGPLVLRGLMCMAPDQRLVGADAVRRAFAATRELAQRHGLRELSMGMSQDVGIAIEEGATVVRIGSRLFR